MKRNSAITASKTHFKRKKKVFKKLKKKSNLFQNLMVYKFILPPENNTNGKKNGLLFYLDYSHNNPVQLMLIGRIVGNRPT